MANETLGESLSKIIEDDKKADRYAQSSFDYFNELTLRAEQFKKKKVIELSEKIQERIDLCIRAHRDITPFDIGGTEGEYTEKDFEELFRWANNNGLTLKLRWGRPVNRTIDSKGLPFWTQDGPVNNHSNIFWVFPKSNP